VGVALVLAVLLVAAPAGAHHSPANCNANKVQLNLSKDVSVVTNGDTVHYTVEVINPGTGAGIGCDAGHIVGAPTGTNTGVDITFFCPAADGTPTGPSTVLATNKELLADNSEDQIFAPVACVINVNAGVTTATARVNGDGSLHDIGNDSNLGRFNELGVTVVQCVDVTDCASITPPEC